MALRAFCNILLHRNDRYIRAIGTYVANVCKKASNSAWECCDFIVKAVFDRISKAIGIYVAKFGIACPIA